MSTYTLKKRFSKGKSFSALLATAAVAIAFTLPKTSLAAEVNNDADNASFQFTPTVEANIGTLGLGLSASQVVNPYLSIRGNINDLPLPVMKYNRDDKLHYKVNFNKFTLGVIADGHPFMNGFRASLGLYYVNDYIKYKHDEDYTSEPTANYKVTGNRVAPYVGVGYDIMPVAKSGFTLSFDLGMLYALGNPTVKVDGGTEDKDQTDDVKKSSKKYLRLVPVVNLGIGYKF